MSGKRSRTIKHIHCWLDSTVALYWIKDQGDYRQFVANRIQKICQHENVIWHYVPTGENPADVGSRGGNINHNNLWKHGPPWLSYPAQWPAEGTLELTPESQAQAQVVREIFKVAIVKEDVLDQLLQKHSLTKIQRAQNTVKDDQQFHVDREQLNLQENNVGILECRGRIIGEYPVYIPDIHPFATSLVHKDIVMPDEVTECFNDYFSGVGSKIANSVGEGSFKYDEFMIKTTDTFHFQTIDTYTVFHMLLSISASKATGLDKIPAKILKIAAPVIAQSLTNLFNYSIQTEIFPTEWKVAKIIPLHKSGPKNIVDNYRPISILSAISKIFEKILYKQLFAYLNNNNLISKHQFGFRPMHSTADALLHSTNEWYRNMDDGMLNIAVFLDLKKAFDTVNHEILIGKLSFLGMQPCALNLITSYLGNRLQRCYVNGYLSKPHKIDYGVPQGSILGPLLFLIYINDLPNCIEKSTVRMFADDTILTASGMALPEIESKINHDLNSVQKWLLANKLCLNLIKTEYLLIGSKQKISKLTNDPVIQIANRLVNRVTNKKSLGVEIDQCLLWDIHLDEICKKVSAGIGAIRKLKPYVARETLVSVYCALVQPYFDYCCLVWEPIGATLSNRLQSLQNRAARVILGYRNEHGQSEAALNELQWKTLKQRRLVMKARLMFRIIHGQAPAVLIESFQNPNAPQHDYNLRNSDYGFYLTKPKTEYMRKTISYSGAKLWNNLPSEVRKSISINTFNSLISDISLS